MKEKKPLISILIASYNHQNFIEEGINSILSQTYTNFELIIVDDCSTDKTAEKIQSIKDKRLFFFQNKFNKGLNSTLNEAFSHARGDFITFLGSDDFFDVHFLEEFVKFINLNGENFTVFYPQIIPVDDDGKILNESIRQLKEPFPTNNEILKNLFLHGNGLSSPGMIINRKAAKKIFPLDCGIHQHQDFIMHIQLLLQGNCAFLPEAKTYYRVPTDSNGHMSSNNVKAYKRIEIETPFALDFFLKGIKTPEKLKDIFGEMLTKYGEPTAETIPYFLARLALDSKDNRLLPVWGFRTLIAFLSADNHQELLYKLYGFQYKDFSALFNNVQLLDDFLEVQRETYENSLSWKITAPIRKVAQLVKKGINK
ncbi:MAG: glycosyltransferase [Spirochaetaceae bacterium]|nr:glycosyltransferase [Spirochaetaceae bacterium]